MIVISIDFPLNSSITDLQRYSWLEWKIMDIYLFFSLKSILLFFSDEVLQYIRDLEDRLGVTDLYRDDQLGSKNHYRGDHLNSKDHYQEDHRRDIENPSPQWNSRPEAVSNAFKVFNNVKFKEFYKISFLLW